MHQLASTCVNLRQLASTCVNLRQHAPNASNASNVSNASNSIRVALPTMSGLPSGHKIVWDNNLAGVISHGTFRHFGSPPPLPSRPPAHVQNGDDNGVVQISQRYDTPCLEITIIIPAVARRQTQPGWAYYFGLTTSVVVLNGELRPRECLRPIAESLET